MSFKVCVIGKLCDESIVWIENLLYLGFKVDFINTHWKVFSNTYLENELKIMPLNLYYNHSFSYGIQSLFELYCLHKRIKQKVPLYFKKTIEILSEHFRKNQYDIIFAWWGIDNFYELYHIIHDLKLKTPIIHCLNTYPSTPIRTIYGFFEDYFYKIFHDRINGRIFYSDEMRSFYERKIYKSKNNYIIMPDSYLSKCYYAGAKLTKNNKLIKENNDPNIVFTGRTDFSYDFRRFKDNVKNEIQKIASKKIHIYLKKSDQIPESEYIHYYPRFSTEDLCNGLFSSYLHQFDASIVIYNEFANKDRFKNGLSTRFAHSLTACIPLISRYSSKFSQDFFQRYQNGFTYSNLSELEMILGDHRKMETYKKYAKQNVNNFSFEVYKNSFIELIHKVMLINN
jgi:hypothetical protein